jgi:hypothetical protein
MTLTLQNEVSNAKRAAIFSATCAVLYLGGIAARHLGFLFAFFAIWALLGLLISAWQLMFHGLSAVALALAGIRRATFQIVAVLVIPLFVSAYFFIDADLTVANARLTFPQLGVWFVVAVVGYISWSAATKLDSDLPFRGFLIATTTLFVLTVVYSGAQRTYYEYSALTRETGQYGYQFLLYVSASYVGLFSRLLLRRRNLPAA